VKSPALLVPLVLCSLLGAAEKTADPEAPSPSGRFGIHTGTVTRTDSQDEHVILKIDTRTGQTWMLLHGPIHFDDRHVSKVSGWLPVHDDAGQAIAEARKRAEAPAKGAIDFRPDPAK